MKNIWQNRALALAGILQALHSVQQIARYGNAPTDAITASLASIFKLNPESAEDVYGGIGKLSTGLQILNQQLNKKRYRADPELLRYLINIMYLEQKLRNHPKLLGEITYKIQLLEQQTEDIRSIQPDTIAQLADIYLNTISTMTPRIQIRGEETHLKQPENIERVRALLLASIRSAVLWRQTGGSRLHLLLYSRQLSQETQILIQYLSEGNEGSA
ncbi:high frequency lysogenization protein hflD [Candidatus Nitrosoglobus terrae]|uniref:High frequency lysogenization protein HflD homolog n=1 Tax=Candidatus Nitrosoglobus terrae TaxID=1630141 RepID=A0A1Q2SME9_9GAMM|nr:high frequency lysogenization protein HflD [Candidatus Nitrosoglobus terrae]BAW80318.1 high frequency lysogenization protein hflD [Candidatus Nitrosoglobus terrae]